MVRPDYSLNAAPRPVGRSMSDPARMQDVAMRRLRSQGDFQGAARLAQSQAWLDARFGGRQPPVLPAGAMPVPQPPPAADANAMPAGGRLVPGRSAGSLVWQTDAPPMPEVPATPPASEAVPALPAPAAPPAVPMLEGINPLTGLPFNDQPSMLPIGTISAGMRGFPGMAPPPPGLHQEPAPPTMLALPGTDYGVPVIGGQMQKQTLPMVPQGPLPPGFVPQSIERGGVRYAAPQQPEPQTIYNENGIATTMQFNPQTGQWEPVPMKKKEAAPSAAAPAAAGPVTLPKGSTAKGATWSLFQP